MEDREKRRALARISSFVLSDQIDEVRDNLQENIVEMAFFWGTREDEFVSKEKIAELVPREIYLVKFPDFILDSILSRLLAKSALEMDENGLYHLTPIKRIEIQKRIEKYKEKINYVNELFIQRLEREYKRKLTKEQKEEGLKTFYSFLAILALEKSDLAARIVARKNVESLPIELNIHILFGVLAKMSEMELRNAEMKTIKSMFRGASEDFCSFLQPNHICSYLQPNPLTQNLMCIQILNLDPQCQSLEREAFSKKALFLDTNVLIALLCPTHWMHKVAEQLVALTHLLEAKCLVTKGTCQEYLAQLEEANSIYKKWQAPYRFFENVDEGFSCPSGLN